LTYDFGSRQTTAEDNPTATEKDLAEADIGSFPTSVLVERMYRVYWRNHSSTVATPEFCSRDQPCHAAILVYSLVDDRRQKANRR